MSSAAAQAVCSGDIVEMVQEERKFLPRAGGKKLYHILHDRLSILKMGRDKLFGVLRANHLLIKPDRQYRKTTDSYHRFYIHPYRLEGFKATAIEQLWVCDITYVPLAEGKYCYLSLVTDAYSRRIVGYALCEDLSTQGPLAALKMAIKGRCTDNKLIHHSDKGTQYCSNAYQEVLKKHKIVCSMTQNHDPYQNAMAERVNGIIKNEFRLEACRLTMLTAPKVIQQCIDLYNQRRPHLALNMSTPNEVHYMHQKISPLKYAIPKGYKPILN